MDKWVQASRFIGIGWFIGLCIVGGVFGGMWLDRKLDTSVLFTLVGLFLGVGVAGFGTYRMISPLIREQDSKDKGNK